jgi:hypothetical protein
MLSRRNSSNDCFPSSSSSLPGSSSRSLYMGGRSFHPGAYGGSPAVGPEQGGIDLTRHMGQPLVPDYIGALPHPLPTMVSPCPTVPHPDTWPVFQDSSHPDYYNNNIPPIGPRYFQDPFLLPRPLLYLSHPITPSGIMDNNLPLFRLAYRVLVLRIFYLKVVKFPLVHLCHIVLPPLILSPLVVKSFLLLHQVRRLYIRFDTIMRLQCSHLSLLIL